MYPIEVADMMVFRQHLNPHKTKRIAQKILKNQAELKDLPSEFRFLYDFCINYINDMQIYCQNCAITLREVSDDLDTVVETIQRLEKLLRVKR